MNDSRGPKYALEGYTHEHQHLLIIFAPENNAMVVVTCIDLDTEWQCPSLQLIYNRNSKMPNVKFTKFAHLTILPCNEDQIFSCKTFCQLHI